MRIRTAAILLILFNATCAMATERSLDKEVIVDATVDQVWDAWTTRAGITSFFSPDAEIDPRVGGAFHIYMDPYAARGMKGADTMTYLALQPKTMLSFDWNAPPSLPKVRAQKTFVVLRFEAMGDTTRMTLHHTGWGDPAGVDGKEWDAAYRYFDRAWDSVLGNLKKRFAPGGKPVDWTEWLQRLKPGDPAKS